MDPTLVDKISSSPSIKWLVLAMAFHIVNVFWGTWLGFFKKSASGVKIHSIFYIAVVVCLAFYLTLHGVHSENSVWDYLVGLYFITALPYSKKWDVAFHALAGILGLLLLPLLILYQFI